MADGFGRVGLSGVTAALERRGMTLAAELKSYSEKGEKYVDLVREIIKFNKLKTLNAAQLAPAGLRRTGV